jgi:hypothetical protein
MSKDSISHRFDTILDVQDTKTETVHIEPLESEVPIENLRFSMSSDDRQVWMRNPQLGLWVAITITDKVNSEYALIVSASKTGRNDPRPYILKGTELDMLNMANRIYAKKRAEGFAEE